MMEKRKTRVAGLHVDNSKPITGEEVTISGYLQWYAKESKRWEPLRAWLKLYVDGREVDRVASKPNGSFEFKYSSNLTGKRKVEVRFAGDSRHESCKKELVIEVITSEQRRRIERIAKIASVIFAMLIVLVFVISLILSKL